MTGLPAADPLLVAETVAALPSRLQGRLDAAVAAAATWHIEACRVVLPGDVEVVLLPQDGVLRRAEQVGCACLLTPTCLHRAAVLAAAPVAGPEGAIAAPADQELAAPAQQGAGTAQQETGVRVRARSARAAEAAAKDQVPASAAVEDGASWTTAEQEAARAVRLAASRLLEAGAPAAGAAVQAELLLALHRARLVGLHRLAGAATRVVTEVRALRGDAPEASLERLSTDLLDVLETAHAVEHGGSPEQWRGSARTAYDPVGGLRLTGLCMEAVVTGSGYAGVVVRLVGSDGLTWSVSDVKPGGPERVRSAAHGPVALGETGLTHRQLSRSGLLLSGATANADGRLGAGRAVRAVAAPGTRWTDEPLRNRFGAANAAPLLLLDLVLCSSTDSALLAVDIAGMPLRLVAPRQAPGRIGQDNQRVLAGAPGLHLLAVARPATGHRTAELLAVGGEDLRLPDEFSGNADLGIDRLSPAYLRPTREPQPWPGTEEPYDPLVALRRRWQRVVSGGRRTLTLPGVDRALDAETAALRRDQLPAGATALAALTASALVGERDAFGRAAEDGGAHLGTAWLAAGVYQRAVSGALRQRQWEQPS